MKKVCYMLLVAAMVLGLTGCGRSGVVTSNNNNESDNSFQQPTSEAPAQESVEPPVSSSTGSGVYPEDGYAEGRFGDAMHTYWFDYTVNSAYLCDEYHGYTPAEGYELLVAEVTVKNTWTGSLEMYDTDFQIQWNDDADDAYDWPITAYDAANKVADEQLADVYSLAINESVTGMLVYEVPAGNADFSISYMEYFADDTTGDTFFVFFSASKQ